MFCSEYVMKQGNNNHTTNIIAAQNMHEKN